MSRPVDEDRVKRLLGYDIEAAEEGLTGGGEHGTGVRGEKRVAGLNLSQNVGNVMEMWSFDFLSGDWGSRGDRSRMSVQHPLDYRPLPSSSCLANAQTFRPGPTLPALRSQDLRPNNLGAPKPSYGPPTPPQPTPTTPNKQPPPSYGGVYFQHAGQVISHLNEVVWYPSMGDYGVPRTAHGRKFYLQKIELALANIKNVWDAETVPFDYAKFLPGGDWTDPKDVEAIAHVVVSQAEKIHATGVVGPAFRRAKEFMSLNAEDVDFTFAQRIQFVAHLLAHSKMVAAQAMCSQGIHEIVALPITSLRLFEAFEREWAGFSDEEKVWRLRLVPYDPSVAHPSVDLQKELKAQTAARFLALNARRKCTARGQSDTQARSSTSQGYAPAQPSVGSSVERPEFGNTSNMGGTNTEGMYLPHGGFSPFRSGARPRDASRASQDMPRPYTNSSSATASPFDASDGADYGAGVEHGGGGY
ncbi:hypothetical protein BDW02DRAFT_577360 [Decorospora gaudefroyi]|uniref:Uncharacterized protein n=1 Tax=Decorospora gaudefroyi TaxID=184978 RepID=A0A6A5KTX9_9PLEO|nr:hypothetical protein BDW02DRAFT_577360 [Decorospora gaudefroyi]